jgi:transposase InsO family protein
LRSWNAEEKLRLLGAIERARQVMPLVAALRVLGLSVGRYYDWVERQQRCTLDDHPPKPKVGSRALSPNEARHIDASIIKLLDGTKAYIHAVMDNYSQRILAWTIAETHSPMNTCYVLEHAAKSLRNLETKVYMDSGVENLNRNVDELLASGTIERVIAQVDVSFSNSMIESWWRSLKHRWLFINHLDNVDILRKLIEFYVNEHNTSMPHGAFDGQTPDEMYFDRGVAVPDELAQKRRAARRRRIDENRKVACFNCRRNSDVVSEDVAA